MIAGNYNILCEQGVTFTRVIAIEQPTEADPEVYEPYPLADHTARMQVRRTIESTTVLISLTTENGRISIDEANGAITLVISAADTAALSSSGVYDLEIIDDSGNVSRVIQGTFTLSPEVTR
jgi:hypothetical protein